MPTLAELEYKRLRRRAAITRFIISLVGAFIGSGLYLYWRQ